METIKKYWAAFFLTVALVGSLWAYANHTQWVSIQRSGAFSPDVYLKNVTDGVLDIATASANATIGDVWVTGRPVSYQYHIAAPTDQWLPTGRDTANAVNAINLYDGDLIFKRARVYATFGSGDTSIVKFYKINTAGTVTAIAMTEGANTGADTLVAANDSSFVLTPSSTTTFDQSAGDALAIHHIEGGTQTNLTLELEFETYDVQ